MINLLAQVDLAHAVSSATADGNLDLNQIAHLSNGNPAVMLALGAVGILGGKKVWDWLKQRQEQQHEEKLAQIEAAKIPAGTGHEQCVAKQEALESQVSSLKGKLGEISSKATESEKTTKEFVEKQKVEVGELTEGVKKLKKKVKKIQEEIEEKEAEAKKKKKRKVEDDEQ